jgi:hypothetical protein
MFGIEQDLRSDAMKQSLYVVFVFAAVGLTGCSSGPAMTTGTKTAAETATKEVPSGPPQPVAAKAAFWEMYTPAHAWAADLQPVGLKSGEVAGVKNADGKAGVWTAIFGSSSKHAIRTYTYSVAEQSPDIVKGVKAGLPESWTGPTNAVMPFQTGDFTVDSDAAYKAAAAKAADWLKQKDNAEKPVAISLGAAAKYPAPIWAIMFGTKTGGFLALVNASNGEVVSK